VEAGGQRGGGQRGRIELERRKLSLNFSISDFDIKTGTT
jgi:hypothetical protein